MIRNLRNIKLRRTHMNLVYIYYNSTKKNNTKYFYIILFITTFATKYESMAIYYN